jgi:hypothetical protein
MKSFDGFRNNFCVEANLATGGEAIITPVCFVWSVTGELYGGA